MVPLRNRAALGKIAMNMSELRKLQGTHATMAYCFALGGNGKAFSRGMLPWELYEDAATGSAAGSLAAYLVRHGKLAPGHTLNILQGWRWAVRATSRCKSRNRERNSCPRERRFRKSVRRHHPHLIFRRGKLAVRWAHQTRIHYIFATKT